MRVIVYWGLSWGPLLMKAAMWLYIVRTWLPYHSFEFHSTMYRLHGYLEPRGVGLPTTSTPQLTGKMPCRPSHGDHKAVHRGTFQSSSYGPLVWAPSSKSS